LILLAIEDITEQKRLSHELELRVQELQESDRRKDEFLATLAHELRNPLAPMQNATQILRHPSLAREQADWCREVLDRQVKQMARLLDDLLDISRITRNVLQFRTERCDLRAIVQAAIEESGPLIEAGGLQLSIELPGDSVPLMGDAARLTQVFSNLLNNAAKYSERGDEIFLSAKRDGDIVSISIKDTGVGIEPELLTRVFEMFTQGESGGPKGGLGLGLTLAKRLVEMHNGSIEARSEGRGKGSEFIVRLPIAPAGSDPIHAFSALGPTRQASKRILVIEDREAQGQSLAMVLELSGHQVRVANNGTSALSIADEFKPEVALIDIGLPDLNGYDVARRLRAQPQLRNLMLIAQTGWGRDEDRQRSREAGFDHHLTKPLDHDMLLRLIAAGHSQ
jgi:CheY-like chemotaxis protein